MHDCTRIEAEISALLDGELPAPEAAAVEAHVRSCPSCAALARDLAAVGRTLRSTVSPSAAPVSPAFRAGVLAKVGVVRRIPKPAVSPIRVAPIRAWIPAASAAAAAFAAVIAGGAYLGFRVVPSVAPPIEPPAGRPLDAPTLLASAETHRASGRADLERRDVLAALGLAPEDPAVRAAFGRAFGFETEAAALPPAAAGDPPPADAGAPVEVDSPELWIGSWTFESPGAYDAYTAFRDRSRGFEMEVAGREDVPAVPGTVTVAAERPVPAEPDPFTRALAGLVVGSPAGGDGSASYQGITVFPLSREGAVAAVPADLPASLASALETGRAVVRDAPGRSAATVLVSNLDAGRSLLVLAGEVLEGGRADRLVARDVLVAPGARNVAVPVYEAEAGRVSPHPYGTRFRSVAGVAGARVRSLALGQARPEDMREFLRGRLDLLDVTSTRHRSLADAWSERGPAAPVLRTVRPWGQEALRALQDPAVVGFAVAQGREILGVEVFGSHELMIREARRLLEGCAIEASTYPGGGLPPAKGDVAALIAAAGRGTAIRTGGEGSGEVGFVARAGGLLGSGVVGRGSVLHASVLPGGPGAAGIARGGRDGDAPEAGDRPEAGGSGGEAGPTPGAGDSSGAGSSAPPATGTGSGDGKKPEPPPPSGERPR